MSHYLFILVGAVLVNNVVLVKILGLCPFMGVSKKLETAYGMGAATTFVLNNGDRGQLHHRPLPADALRPGVSAHTVLHRDHCRQLCSSPKWSSPRPRRHCSKRWAIYLPLITTNCAVLGVPLLNISNNYNFVDSLLFGAGSAIGFSLVLILFAGIRERIEGADVPIYFRGVAIAMVTAGLMSLGLHGFCRTGQVPIMDIVLAIAIMALGAVVLGAALGFASIKFKVEGDPLVEKIEAILPQTQCGQCGYPGCKPYAEAIAKGDEINKCPPGGAEGVQRLADLLGREAKAARCRGKTESRCGDR